MATKTMLIPVAALGEAERIGFLELSITPRQASSAQHNPFQRLAQPGLKQAEAAAWRAWEVIPPPLAVDVRVASPIFGLTNASGAALGLALCPFLCTSDAAYRIAIVMGGLDEGVQISAVGQLAGKLRAIRKLGYRAEPTLLVYADDGSDEAQQEAAGLAMLNIAVRPVETFNQACLVCQGDLHSSQ